MNQLKYGSYYKHDATSGVFDMLSTSNKFWVTYMYLLQEQTRTSPNNMNNLSVHDLDLGG